MPRVPLASASVELVVSSAGAVDEVEVESSSSPSVQATSKVRTASAVTMRFNRASP